VEDRRVPVGPGCGNGANCQLGNLFGSGLPQDRGLIFASEEARAELSRIRHETDKGTFTKPSDITVSDYLDEYLIGATRGRRESTKTSYRDALRPVRERLGDRKI
jgi:hypothetical protein